MAKCCKIHDGFSSSQFPAPWIAEPRSLPSKTVCLFVCLLSVFELSVVLWYCGSCAALFACVWVLCGAHSLCFGDFVLFFFCLFVWFCVFVGLGFCVFDFCSVCVCFFVLGFCVVLVFCVVGDWFVVVVCFLVVLFLCVCLVLL